MNNKTVETMGYFVNGLSIPLLFYLMFTLEAPESLRALEYLGWILLGVGIGLVVLSITALVRNQDEGLIDRGIYGLVRHPMYLGGMTCFVSFFCFLPHWAVLAISAVNVAVVYGFTLQGDQQNATKFGNAYNRYMKTVPRVNLLAGIFKRLRSK